MPTPPHVAAALAELNAARGGYDRAEAYYLGNTEERFTSRKLQLLLGATAGTYKVNFARTAVDAVLERTEVSGISSSDAGAKAYLDAVWEENQLGLEAKDIHRMAYEYGDAYVIALPDDSYVTGVSLYAHSPKHVRVFYDPQHPRKKSHAVQRWHEVGSEENQLTRGRTFLRVNVYYADRVEQYVSRSPLDDTTNSIYADSESLADLVQYDDDIPLTFGVVPVFHFKTGRPYGRPEHADGYGPQDMINKVLITMMAAIDYAGFPQRYVLTDDGLAAGDAFSDAAPSSLADEGADFDSSPGATWLLQAAKGVGQFSTADTQNFLRPLDSLIRQMAVVTDTPMHMFDLGGQTPSGESRRAAEAPLVKKVQDREASFGVTWREVFSFCLRVAGLVADAELAWTPAASVDDMDSWKTAESQLAVGVPLTQIALERGYDADLVATWKAESDARAAQVAAAQAAALQTNAAMAFGATDQVAT